MRTEAGEVGRKSGCRSPMFPGNECGTYPWALWQETANYYVGGCNYERLENCCTKMGSLLNSHIKTIDNPVTYGGR